MNGTPYAAVPNSSITRLAPTSVRERRTRDGTRGARGRDSIMATGAPALPPADVRRLDNRVDEQDERAGDRHRPGGVVASPAQRGPALAQEHRRQRERGQAEGDGDEEDRVPAGTLDK